MNTEINTEINTKKQSQQVTQKATLIWNIADILTGVYKPHEYGEVILPFTVIKRFHDALLPTLEKVWETEEKVKDFEIKEVFYTNASGYQFYNTSKYTFETLLSDSESIESNFRSYINGFSENVRDILEHYEIDKQITKLVQNNLLFAVIQEFNSEKGYLGPDKITSTEMGYIFEELVRRFSESYNEEAGQHFTSRDIIYLMTDLLIAGDESIFKDSVGTKTVYDQAMGTSQMLSAMAERLTSLDSDASIATFGQEINPQTFAIAKSDTMIRGGESSNMRLGNTLTEDKFKGFAFDYCISNPPFGRSFKKDIKALQKEYALGEQGRFAPGLPRTSDGQMLFLLNGISKLKENGRMAIVHNGSPLFTGAPGSGESEIRKYVIENDWLDCIIQLPNDLFYNTGITTYIWVLDKDKPKERINKVQLIDASKMFTKRRRNIGNKRVDLLKNDRDLIVTAYGDYLNKAYKYDGEKFVESKIFDNNDFGFTRITIESPKLDDEGKIVKNSKGEPKVDTSLRDTEDVPLRDNIEEYYLREVKPFNENSWMDRNKDVVGYEIPFTRLFYKYEAPESSDLIAERIKELEEQIVISFETLSGKDVKTDD